MVLFALSLFVLLGLSGLAIDQSVGYSTRMLLQTATDAAVLTTAKSLADGDDWNSAKSKGEHIFNANITKVPGSTIALMNDGTPGNYQVNATAQAPWKRTITFLFDTDARKIQIKGGSYRQRKPVEVIFLADVSYSMGIGATRSDIDKMTKITGCAFACHVDGTDTRARKAGARMRIDVIQDAYRQAIQDIKQTMNSNDKISVGLITFSNSVVDSVTPTQDFNAATNSASLIKFPTADQQGGTDFHAAAAAATALIAERKKVNREPTTYVVVWLTDAVEDTRMLIPRRVEVRDTTIPITSPVLHQDASTDMMPFSQNLCDGMKAQGAYVMVLNTIYVTDGWSLVTTGLTQFPSVVLSAVPDRLNHCTGNPDYVQIASDPTAIINAASTLAKLAISKELRIAN